MNYKFRFQRQKNGSVYAFDSQTTKRLATYQLGDVSWECVLNRKHELASEEVATAMDAAFNEWLDKESAPQQEEPEKDTEAETPTPALAVVPPCPEPDPVSGTAGIDYMLWHAAHASKETLIEIYGNRLEQKPTFRKWIEATPELAPFLARIINL